MGHILYGCSCQVVVILLVILIRILAFTLMRIRILLVTLIQILAFTLMRIRIQASK